MTDENMLKLAKEFENINIVKERLAQGLTATYRDEKRYPGKMLKEYPDGRLESIDIDMDTFETIVLEVLREGKE